MLRYWVVGAMEEGKYDHLDKYLRRGYWELSYTDAEKPHYAELRNSMAPGDRIAVKKSCGGTTGKIEIRAIGIITDNEPREGRVYVNWLVTHLERTVGGHGCFGSIHGPYSFDEEWVRKVFCI